MDFKEYLVKRNKSVVERILTVLIYLSALVLSCVCLFKIPSVAGFGALLAVGCFYGAYRLSSRFKREYEYIITGDSVDIDVIYNAANRKRLISFSIKDVRILAAINDVNYTQMAKGSFGKTIDATTNRKDANIYFAILEKNGGTLVKFEPPYAALEMLKKHAPSKVVISE